MLHELLLALSGHPSPLLESLPDESTRGPFHEHLSPAEAVLLQRLAQDLGEKHKTIRGNATKIGSTHPSIVCRAIATAIDLTHLANFQQAILDVERDILQKNPSIVGAYNIVPLSGIVGAFDGWSRKLQWLSSLVNYIQAEATSMKQDRERASCTAAQVIKWLRDSANTGYPDIEQLSYQVINVAETAWLRQLSAWVLYGKLPVLGASDFFVHLGAKDGGQGSTDGDYEIANHLIPIFVTPSTANSILFIGKSLNHIRNKASGTDELHSNAQPPELVLLPRHLAHLSSLEPPISTPGFSAAISAIRLSLSQNALQRLLPIYKVLEILRILRDFYLLERGEFAIALITAADQRLASRQSRFSDKLGQKDANILKRAIIKEGEVSAVLARTWAAMASLQSADEDDIDEDLELARNLVSLSIKSLGPVTTENRGTITPTFDDLLLPTPTTLTLHIPSPLDLFLTPSDVDTYSRIHSYLLSLRRAHLRLSKTFLLSVLRRDHPSPKTQPHSDFQSQFETLERRRHRASHRTKNLRPVWATVSSAAFLLAELGEHFQGEVIKSSWHGFHAWLDPISSGSASRPGTSSSIGPAPLNLRTSTSSQRSIQPASDCLHDPESLTQAHRTYLSSLTHSLLLDDPTFTTELRAFMSAIDHLSALMHRLDTVYQNLDLETDLGIVDTLTNYAAEEKDVMYELSASRSKVAEGVGKLVEALKAVDAKRVGGDGGRVGMREEGEDIFVPERSVGVDRLLLKLDWGELGMGF